MAKKKQPKIEIQGKKREIALDPKLSKRKPLDKKKK